MQLIDNTKKQVYKACRLVRAFAQNVDFYFILSGIENSLPIPIGSMAQLVERQSIETPKFEPRSRQPIFSLFSADELNIL